MIVAGLDPSLTGFGVALVSRGAVVNAARLSTGALTGHDRLEQLVDLVTQWCAHAGLVVIEGPSYRSPSGAQVGHHERAGLWWAITHELWRDRVPVAVAAPATRAVYATGSGRADKNAVKLAVSQRWGIGEVRDDNVADALVFAAMGGRHVGEPLPDGGHEQLHARALTSVQWPFPAIVPTSEVPA